MNGRQINQWSKMSSYRQIFSKVIQSGYISFQQTHTYNVLQSRYHSYLTHSWWFADILCLLRNTKIWFPLQQHLFLSTFSLTVGKYRKYHWWASAQWQESKSSPNLDCFHSMNAFLSSAMSSDIWWKGRWVNYILAETNDRYLVGKYFHIHFIVLKLLWFVRNFPKVCFQGYKWIIEHRFTYIALTS